MAFVSIVVPVYHNAGSLHDLFQAFRALAERNANDRFEFVFVDDGSKDESFARLRELVGQDARVRVVKLARNFGSTAAVLAGLEHARGDAIATLAADLQDPPEVIDRMLEHWRQGRKVVIAARADRDDPGLTALFASMFYALFRRFAIATMPRQGFDFFLIDRAVCDLIQSIPERNTYLMGLLLWLGFEPALVHYQRRGRPRRYGASMWTFTRKLKYFIDSFVAFSYLPIRAATLLGFFFSVGGVLYALCVVFARLVLDVQAEGWASLMVVILLVSGVQLMMTGILGEYLWRTLEETRRRPRFIVEELVGPLPQENTDRHRHVPAA